MNDIDIKKIPDKLDILYNPDLSYDKQYDSEGHIEYTNKIEEDSYYEDINIENNEDDSLSSYDDLVKEIDTILNLLPEDMKDVINNPLSIIESLYDEIKNVIYKPIVKDEIITNTNTTNDNNNNDNNNDNNGKGQDKNNQNNETNNKHDQTQNNDINKDNTNNNIENSQDNIEDQFILDGPDNFFRDDEDQFIIKTSNKDKLVIIKETYKYDLACIINDYNNKIKNLLNNYINNVLILFKNLDVSIYSKILNTYDLSTDKVSTNYKHLSDLIIRSQTTRQMNMRLYNKIFSIDKTISHIRSCKIGVEQRLRYYTSEYQEDSSFNNFISNRFLENSRMMYDEKYKQNFFNLYKYLNSSVILLNECFNLLINEAQAKIILIEKEGTDLW